ncbi:glycosyl-4,4'-diaponeurosporenoate acyltransferase [Desemzia incerta]|uniref:glycosyl-4,4'-diaponeurosporenoate acyltransferase CrtO family protein n=1 Tax=Desemzia incerta TaxID=82801 RepID=UPI003CFD0CF7
MQFIHLADWLTIAVDIIAWYSIHLSVSWLARLVPEQFLDEKAYWFLTKKWEKEGEIWQEVFRVRTWKPYLPDGTKITKEGFDKTHLKGFDIASLEKFVLETRRAELAHWAMIPPAGLFFFWNPTWAGWIMIGYAVLFNLPLIFVQRYNRPRLERMIHRKVERSKVKHRITPMLSHKKKLARE